MPFDDLRDVLRNVSAIPVTPFAPDGSVDLGAYGRLVERLALAGVNLVTPNGNTSEFYALSPAEARASVPTAIATKRRQLPVLFDEPTDAVESLGIARVILGDPDPAASAEYAEWVLIMKTSGERLGGLSPLPNRLPFPSGTDPRQG